MREILFRAKRKDNGEWVEGYYIKATHHWHEHGKHEDWIVVDTIQNGGWCNVRGKYAVIPETVGQYTGLTDKNGKKIFEGDIVKTNEYWCEIGVVKYGEGTFDSGIYRYTGFYYEDKDGYIDHHNLYQAKDEEDVKFVVIGNIHDNPELLE